MARRRSGQQFEGRIVLHAAGFIPGLDYSAVAVRHVFAEADIRDDEQFRERAFQFANGPLDNAVSRVGAGGPGILRIRNAKENTAGTPSSCAAVLL